MGLADKIKQLAKDNTYQTYTPGTYTESNELKDLKALEQQWYGTDYKQFQWDNSMLGDNYRNYENQLNALQKPEWSGYSRQGDWDNILNQITNMKDFSYDVNGDALYQQYKDQYTTQGKMAMMDTMGQAAALTGGYGNSYAQSVGQQTYQGYMQQLTDKVPELYSLALSKYNSDKDDLYRQNDLHQNLFSNEYGMYRNAVSDYNTERDYLTGRMDTEYSRDYNSALAENDSYNSIVSNNRNDYSTAVNNLANREWNQYTGEESLAAQAIQIYNNQLAQKKSDALNQEQFNWQKEQSNLQAENDALKHKYVVDDAMVDKVAKGILTRGDFESKAQTHRDLLPNGNTNYWPTLGVSTTYWYDGKAYSSYEEYVEDSIRNAYADGKGFSEATLNALLDLYETL